MSGDLNSWIPPGKTEVIKEQLTKKVNYMIDNIIRTYEKLEDLGFGANYKDFDYFPKQGPPSWNEKFPDCGGLAQSPININAHQTVPKVYKPLHFRGYIGRQEGDATIANNGHSACAQRREDDTRDSTSRSFPQALAPAQCPELGDTVQANSVAIVLERRDEAKPTVSGGPLKGTYNLSQILFHWGKSNKYGSEHTINNSSYAMEVHLVHHNKKFPSIKEALDFVPDGDESSKTWDFEKIVEKLPDISKPESVTHMKQNDAVRWFIKKLNNPYKDEDYYTYTGSMTTPPCTEEVTWIVYSRPIGLLPDHLAEFRQLRTRDSNELTLNLRPVQDKNGRDIYRASPAKRFIVSTSSEQAITVSSAITKSASASVTRSPITLAPTIPIPAVTSATSTSSPKKRTETLASETTSSRSSNSYENSTMMVKTPSNETSETPPTTTTTTQGEPASIPLNLKTTEYQIPTKTPSLRPEKVVTLSPSLQEHVINSSTYREEDGYWFLPLMYYPVDYKDPNPSHDRSPRVEPLPNVQGQEIEHLINCMILPCTSPGFNVSIQQETFVATNVTCNKPCELTPTSSHPSKPDANIQEQTITRSLLDRLLDLAARCCACSAAGLASDEARCLQAMRLVYESAARGH
uniref:Carbonic anhydrase n=1 Tax=Timema poppense TaxID=170557 RepID=A0A7R9D683_TIMPO|nr:unnamed protein product [Timema poppensis]